VDRAKFIEKLGILMEDAQNGILATKGGDGYPHMRWMTPILKGGLEDPFLCAITSANFPKMAELSGKSQISWLFTSPKTREVISLFGVVQVNSNPRYVSEMMEEMGRKLAVFWKVNDDPSSLVCLETGLVSGEHFDPRTGEKSKIKF